ncbi:isoaspartyl peptidase/L-asparaginase family protein [Candidatus Neomarinimicrobiota bacterium]
MSRISIRKSSFVISFLLAIGFIAGSCGQPDVPQIKFGLVIHGGAGNIQKENTSDEMEEAYRAALTEALEVGYEILQHGGEALDAVEAVIVMMEDSPLFNAGKGAVFNSEGQHELDASIMDGRMLQAGAVTGVKTVKNPIRLARLVMEESEHVLLAGDGAQRFGAEQNIDFVPEDYFYTQRRWESLQRARQREQDDHGTVGAVALDQAGNLAAGTSTGGMTNKRFGRIGDSPIIGAGTYADNQTCAVSCTGHGEYFIRAAIAYDISARMAYGGNTLHQASHDVIEGKLTRMGGTGGAITIDKNGHIAMTFNTQGMFRGYVDENGNTTIKMYGNE